jgi:hypothetical protein
MSLIKQLREENNLNIIDALSLFNPSEKTKYVELLLNICKKTKGIERHVEDIKNEMSISYGVERHQLDKFNNLQILQMWRFVEATFNREDLKQFKKFIEYNERGLIPENDLTRITNFEQIITSNSLAEVKTFEKDLEKQVKQIYSDNEWLVIRPLTFHSSKKYGSSTKWCTTMESDASYFERYTKEGILIYTINKLTGLKVATHKYLVGDYELTFWNQVDSRIDSLDSKLPFNILEVIKNEIDSHPVSNRSLLSQEDLEKEMVIYREVNGLRTEVYPVDEPTEMAVEEDVTEENAAPIYLRNELIGEPVRGN